MRHLAFERLLDQEHVAQRQAACDELFDLQLRLADHLTKPGALVIQGESIVRVDSGRRVPAPKDLFQFVISDPSPRQANPVHSTTVALWTYVNDHRMENRLPPLSLCTTYLVHSSSEASNHSPRFCWRSRAEHRLQK